jgi:hypothetical protein
MTPIVCCRAFFGLLLSFCVSCATFTSCGLRGGVLLATCGQEGRRGMTSSRRRTQLARARALLPRRLQVSETRMPYMPAPDCYDTKQHPVRIGTVVM